jgi:hypothetical protein
VNQLSDKCDPAAIDLGRPHSGPAADASSTLPFLPSAFRGNTASRLRQPHRNSQEKVMNSFAQCAHNVDVLHEPQRRRVGSGGERRATTLSFSPAANHANALTWSV